ncbi:MAG: SUF system Fe-S cluster assembly protein [Acidobacteriota bacterium]
MQHFVPLGSASPETPSSEPSESSAESPASGDEASSVSPPSLEDQIIEQIKTVYDPEIPVNVYEMGLIYNVAVGDDGHVDVTMTLTSPACPVAGTLPGEVRAKVEGVEGVESAEVEIVWDPVWNPSMMSEAARLELGML